jgi:hypothetical protein
MKCRYSRPRAYRKSVCGRRSVAPLISTFGTRGEISGQFHYQAALFPGTELPVHFEKVAGCAPKPARKLWRGEGLIAWAANRTVPQLFSR